MQSVFELAKKYYPTLWPKERIEALVKAKKLSEEQAQEIFKQNEK